MKVHVSMVYGIFLICWLSSCGGQSLIADYQDAGTTSGRIEIPVNRKAETEIQKAVEDGHQPWRLIATEVAYVALTSYKIDVSLKDCILQSEDKNNALVTARGDTLLYRVFLRRLIKRMGSGPRQELKLCVEPATAFL